MTQTVQPINQNFARPSWRPETQSGLDPDMRRMAMVAGALGIGVALVIGAVSLSRHVHHGVPVIQPAAGPVKVKPLDPGGMKVAGAEESVSGVEALGPAAEKPALHALRAKARAKEAAKTASAAPVHTVALPAVAAAPLPQKASLVQPLAIKPPPPLSVAAPRGASVQLAAFETPQAAKADWDQLATKTPGLLAGHTPDIERAQLAGHTVYQLRAGGFANIAAATSFCIKVRAHGGECSIATF